MKFKKILTLIIINMLFSFGLYSQISYPRYQIDSLGQKVIVMTIKQAQELDNNSDLLELYKKSNKSAMYYDSICLMIVNNKEIVINKQKILISELNNNIDIKGNEIKNLQKQVTEYQMKEGMFNDQLVNLKEQISIRDEHIRKTKNKMILGGVISGSSIIGLIVAILVSK